MYTTTLHCRCGNVAAILELDENLQNHFLIFQAVPNVSDSVCIRMHVFVRTHEYDCV